MVSEALLQQVTAAATQLKEATSLMHRRVVGQDHVLKRLVMALVAEGHVLLEGFPGLAKTTAVKTLAEVCHFKFSRIQFTPDLLPSDVIGTQVYDPRNASFRVKRGPVFTNLLLADEINRAPAKVQSALLECMQERQVTIGEETFTLDAPFMVLATQNPLEQQGTYPLPEAQLDRFMFKVVVEYGSLEDEERIVSLMASVPEDLPSSQALSTSSLTHMQKLVHEIQVAPEITRYAVRIVSASRPSGAGARREIAENIAWGASPRASIALVKAARVAALMDGRAYVIPDDVKEVAIDVLRHRIVPSMHAETTGVGATQLATRILETVPVP